MSCDSYHSVIFMYRQTISMSKTLWRRTSILTTIVRCAPYTGLLVLSCTFIHSRIDLLGVKLGHLNAQLTKFDLLHLALRIVIRFITLVEQD